MCILGVFGIDVESVSKNLRMFFPEEFSTPSFKNPRGANAPDCPPIWAPMLCVPTSLPKEIAFWKQVDKSFHNTKSVVSATEVRERRRVRQHFVYLAGTRACIRGTVIIRPDFLRWSVTQPACIKASTADQVSCCDQPLVWQVTSVFESKCQTSHKDARSLKAVTEWHRASMTECTFKYQGYVPKCHQTTGHHSKHLA